MYFPEASARHIRLDRGAVMIDVGSQSAFLGQRGEQLEHSLVGNVTERVVFQPVPGTEQQASTRLQHAPCLGKGSVPVWKEHDTELAEHRVERLIAKGQGLSICLTPAHPFETWQRRPQIEHRLVEIR